MKRAAGFKVLGMMSAGLALAGTGVAAPLAALADVDASSVQVIEREAIEYDKIPNVTGEFSFCQDALTPGDDVFNLFGTATTTVCAKPGFAFDQVSRESYYLNIGGEVQKVYTVGLDQIEQMEQEKTAIEQQVKLQMQDAAYGTAPGYKVSWVSSESKRVDSQRLRKEQPDIFNQYSKNVSSRRFTIIHAA